jgi:LPS export ABC transporter protein LptC
MRTVLIVLFLLVVIVGAILANLNAQQQLGQQAGQTAVTPQAPAGAGIPDEGVAGSDVVAEDVAFTFTENATKRWDIRAHRAVYYKNKQGARLEDVQGELYDPRGQLVARFKAPTGKYEEDHKQVELSGGVSVESARKGKGQALTVRAPKMSWNAVSPKILAQGGVSLNAEGFGETRADKAIFTQDFSSIELAGNAVTNFSL